MRKMLARHVDLDDLLTITRQSIQWTGGDSELDVARFERLLAACSSHAHGELLDCSECIDRMQQAVALYRGELLHGLFLEHSQQFEEWLLLKRELLHRQALNSLQTLTLHHEARGEYEQMRVYAMRQVALEAWREGAHMEVMRALAYSGQRAAALAQYEICRRTLEQELGVEPSPETTALRDQIEAGLERPELPDPPGASLLIPPLPAPASPLLGRAELLAEVVARFHDPACRLLTLTGPGGVGKTHLALEAASAMRAAYDGTGFVSLAAISEAELVMPTIAHALGVRSVPGQSLLSGLEQALDTRRLLLVIDNFEQVNAAAPQLGELLAHAPNLALLVTSRTALRLRVAGELAVPPLALPAAHMTRSDIAEYPAIDLFVRRAQARLPTFRLTEANATLVAGICTRLDGLPLAIELAAARITLLSPELLFQRLASRLHVLTGGMQDLPARHQTLRATIDWSYKLLAEHEQRLFAHLAQFVGGCTVEAVEALFQAIGEPADVLDALQSLIDNSLLRLALGEDDVPRFGMLETIREYALERLCSSGEAEAVRAAHAAYYLELAEAAAPRLAGSPDQIVWFGRVAAELDNFRAVLRWAVEQHKAAIALRLSTALREFWMTRAYLSEGRQWLEAALGLDDQTSGPVGDRLRGKALTTAGWLAANSKDYAAAERLFEQSLDVARRTEDARQIIAVLGDAGQAARMRGDGARAVTLYEESLALSRREGDPRGVAWALCNLGIIAHNSGETARSAALLQESIAVAQAVGDQVCRAWCLTFVARVARDRGEYTHSAAVFKETLGLFRELGHSDGIAFTLEGCAGLALELGNTEMAARWFGAAEALRITINRPQPPYIRDLQEADADTGAAWQTAWAEGRGLTVEQAIAEASMQLEHPNEAASQAKV